MMGRMSGVPAGPLRRSSRRLRAAALTAAWGAAALPLAAQEPPAPPPPPGAAAASPPAAGRISWTGDRMRLMAGDLVTVLVDEYTLATANRDEALLRDRNRNLGLAGGSGDTSVSAGLRSTNDERDRSRAETVRRDRFATDVTTRVVEVGPDGSLRLEGSRLMRIDDHEQTLVVRGWVRPGDIGSGNAVPSYRLADAEIIYRSNGKLGRSRSFLGRLIDRVWP